MRPHLTLIALSLGLAGGLAQAQSQKAGLRRKRCQHRAIHSPGASACWASYRSSVRFYEAGTDGGYFLWTAPDSACH